MADAAVAATRSTPPVEVYDLLAALVVAAESRRTTTQEET